MRIEFNQKGTFQAIYAAERWCRDNGVSFGSSCAIGPTCLMRGDFAIAKWRNLTAKERSECHGIMSGDFREGPVFIDMKDLPAKQEAGQRSPSIPITPVASSNIVGIGYDDTTMTMAVQFKSGGTYHYPGVKKVDYDALLNADSVGKHYHSNIKGKFESVKVEAE